MRSAPFHDVTAADDDLPHILHYVAFSAVVMFT